MNEDKKYECLLLLTTKKGWNNAEYRQVKCYCGKVLALNGLGSHLHYKHNKKKHEVSII